MCVLMASKASSPVQSTLSAQAHDSSRIPFAPLLAATAKFANLRSRTSRKTLRRTRNCEMRLKSFSPGSRMAIHALC